MPAKERPKSLEGRWDILYRDYPQVYEEWRKIPMAPDFVDVMVDRFPLAGKMVVDVGSGAGLSTFKLAAHADFVIGVEIEQAMLAVAMARAKERGVENVRFVLGDAGRLALEDNAFDAAVAITLADRDVRRVAREMERVVRPGGLLLRVDVAPGWYGGELGPVISGKPRNETPLKGARDDILAGLGYEALDLFMHQDYGTVERVVRTYGFIHSERVIDYVREYNVTTIRWKFRARFKTVA